MIVISSAGLFADGWDLQVMNLVLAVLKHEYSEVMTPGKESLLACMTFVGVILGQFSFGCLGDILGRKGASLCTAVLTSGGVVASACVTDNRYLTIAGGMAICRFFAGLGIGGEYPLSAAIAKEMGGQSLGFSRMQLLQINIMMLNLGSLSQALFFYILLSAHADIEATWRAGLAAGALPTLVALLFRAFVEEPEPPHPRGRRLSSFYESGTTTIFGKLFPTLLGCGVAWMVFGFASYGQGTFSHVISQELLGVAGEDIVVTVKRASIFAMITSAMVLAGNLASSYTIERYGVPVHSLQMASFLLMAAFVWLCCLSRNIRWLAALFFFLSNVMAGAVGITTYTMPTMYFPKAVRATACGTAAGLGKVGAAVGTAVFPVIEESASVYWALFVSGAVVLTGVLVTAATPRTVAAT